MKTNREPVFSWFGFTRRERRSAFILLIILISIIAIRYIVPEKNIDIEYIYPDSSAINDSIAVASSDKPVSFSPFPFNPNTASFDTLIRIGLTSKAARTLIKYRNKGGKFKNPPDIKKVYGIEKEQAEKLIPFIAVHDDTTSDDKRVTPSQKKILLDVNSCDSAQLVQLPGIGPVLSSRIIKYRHLLGGFARIDQIKDVYGLSTEIFNLNKERLFADTSVIKRININSGDYRELARIPYIEKFEVTSILKYRELKGRIIGTNDLVENKLITSDKAIKIRPYLRFE
jgi:competence protein ComEA